LAVKLLQANKYIYLQAQLKTPI